MIEALKTILRGLAVTVALTAGSLAIVTTLYILVRFAPEGASVGDVTDWYRVVRLIVSTAALGGLLADSVRWLAAMLWPANPDPRVRLSDIKR